MSGIFSRIFPYRQRDRRTPQEDFFTETFAAVVSRPSLFRDEFVKWLFELEPENIKLPEIETQKHFDNGRPDICVEVRDTDNKSYVAIIESKIDSCERENQLKDYESILEKKWPEDSSKILVYITKYNEDVSDYENSAKLTFRQHKWSGLYKRFAKAKQISPERVGTLEHELLKLMEDWNMDGGCINAAHLRSFITLLTCCNDKGFENGVGEMLTYPQSEAWKESGLDNYFKESKGNKWSSGGKYRWKGEQYSPKEQFYGLRIWMGFRHDRGDNFWNVHDLGIPSPAVTLCHDSGRVDQEFPRPSGFWTDPGSVEGWTRERWIRQPMKHERPKYGDALEQYYKEFFQTVFNEIKEAIENSAVYQNR